MQKFSLHVAHLAQHLLHRLGLCGARFRGVFASHSAALDAVRPGLLAGYDHDDVAPISFSPMCQLQPWDEPVLQRLRLLVPAARTLLDAGGHMATKYRALKPHLHLPDDFVWTVYDVPAVIRAGRERADRDGLTQLAWIDSLQHAPAADILLASGLLQYLNVPFADLLAQLPNRPRHLLLNKVATREGRSIYTLENFGCAEVPYQIRNRAEFLAELDHAGYDVVDQWEIPQLANVITTHPLRGASTSRGFYAIRRTDR